MPSFSRALSATTLTGLLLLASACGTSENRAEPAPGPESSATPSASPSASASASPSASASTSASASPSASPKVGATPATSEAPSRGNSRTAAPQRTTAPAPRTAAPKPKATTPAKPSVSTESGIRSQVYAQHAATRRAQGLGALTTNSCLQRFAESHAKKLASAGGGLSHQNLGPILSGCSMNMVGENVAAGQSSAAAAQSSWMNSSGHRANILKTEHNRIGAAVQRASNGSLYYVVVFGRAG